MYFYQSINSPLGKLHLVADQNFLVALYTEHDLKNEELSPLMRVAKKSLENNILTQAKLELEEYFSGERIKFTVPLNPRGTQFQTQAWNALVKIPYGKVWSYGEQAKFLNKPQAQRAVGGANGKNPIPIIIPCHRVVGSTGKLTGFSGGMEMKIFLLKHEGHKLDTRGLVIL